MSIILKRGLEGNRSGLSLQPGEPIFTTDTKRLYLGITGASTGVELTFGQLTASFISASTITASGMKVDMLEATTIIGSLESASYVDYSNVANKPTLVSGSAQVLNGSGVYSSSAQLPSGLISGSSQVTMSYAVSASYAPTAANVFIQGGNSFGTAATIGTTDSYSVTIKAGNSSGLTIMPTGNAGIGVTVPTAVLHLKAGTATAGTAPLKLTAGPVNTTPEAGAIEFDGTNYWLSI